MPGLGDVARKRLRAAHKTAAVNHQAQRHQRAVATLFLGAPTMGFAVVRDFAFEIGVGQVVQGDGGVQVKQVAGLGKQRVLKGRMAFPEDVGGTVQGYQ